MVNLYQWLSNLHGVLQCIPRWPELVGWGLRSGNLHTWQISRTLPQRRPMGFTLGCGGLHSDQSQIHLSPLKLYTGWPRVVAFRDWWGKFNCVEELNRNLSVRYSEVLELWKPILPKSNEKNSTYHLAKQPGSVSRCKLPVNNSGKPGSRVISGVFYYPSKCLFYFDNSLKKIWEWLCMQAYIHAIHICMYAHMCVHGYVCMYDMGFNPGPYIC